MTIVIEQVLLLMLFMAAGYALCKLGITNSIHSGLLSKLCFYIFLPATIFNTFSANFTPQYLKAHYSLILVSAVALVVMILAAKPIARLLTKDEYRRKIFRYSLTVSNYGYVGYALTGGIFGSVMLQNLMMYVLPVSMYTYSIGYCMLTGKRVTWKRLCNPPMLAMLAGGLVGFFGIDLPSAADLFITKASACMSPVSMLMTGMVISEYPIASLLKDRAVYLVTALRLLVLPLTAAFILRLLGLDSAVIPAVMFLAMPCGLNTVVFPKLIGEDCRTGAALAFVSSILCCVTIPLCLLLLGGLS